jgi:hypothetical protein
MFLTKATIDRCSDVTKKQGMQTCTDNVNQDQQTIEKNRLLMHILSRWGFLGYFSSPTENKKMFE